MEIMKWYHYAIAIIFIILIASPVWFFKQVEKYLLQNNEDENYQYIEHYIHPDNIIKNHLEDFSHEKDILALQRFDRIIKSSKKRDVKKLWKIKKAEYQRQMRWKTISQ